MSVRLDKKTTLNYMLFVRDPSEVWGHREVQSKKDRKWQVMQIPKAS